MKVTITENNQIAELPPGFKHCRYLPKAITYENGYDTLLKTLAWEQEEVFVYGKLHKLERQACRYGSDNSEGYSGVGVERHPIKEKPKILLDLTERMDEITKNFHSNHLGYNFILCNYYANGKAYIGYHSDGESDYIKDVCICSLSFGATRDFTIKDKTNNETYKIPLNEGDVFIMEPGFQQKYKHSIPKRANAEGRINLTFRIFK